MLLPLFIFSACNDTKDTSANVLADETGVHFQGRDCLSCHNKDLGLDSHLSLAGTLFRSPTSDKNNLNESCKELIHAELYKDSTLYYKTKDFNPLNSPGFNGRGNFFALLKDMPIEEGNYQIFLLNDDGKILAQTGGETHTFSSGFDSNTPNDTLNRHSCNACHQQPPFNSGGAPGLIYTNISTCN